MWQLLVLSTPVIAAAIAGWRSRAGWRATGAIVAGVVVALCSLAVGAVANGHADEIALVLLVSVAWVPFLIAGALAGVGVGRRLARHG